MHKVLRVLRVLLGPQDLREIKVLLALQVSLVQLDLLVLLVVQGHRVALASLG